MPSPILNRPSSRASSSSPSAGCRTKKPPRAAWRARRQRRNGRRLRSYQRRFTQILVDGGFFFFAHVLVAFLDLGMPKVDGYVLDLVIDFFTCVIVPALL